MEKKEYLTEENYEKTKSKISKVALIILIAGLIIGISLILVGIIAQSNAKKVNEERYNEAYKKVEEKITTANARLKVIENEKTDLNQKIQKKQYECDSMDMDDQNWFADSTKCQGEVSSLRQSLNKLTMEELQLKNADYTVYYNKISPTKYVILYILGGLTIFISLSVSGSVYLITKRREIAAFTIQQSMPLAQEGIEKMAPTVSKAAGTFGKEIVKGIREGLTEDINKDK